MAQIQSYYFDFQRTPNVFDDWNIKFKVAQMNGSTKNYKIIFASDCYDNINDNINNGVLNSSVKIYDSKDCALLWSDETISLASDVRFQLNDEIVPLKGMFLVDKSTNYVIGYSININPFDVTNEVIFEKGLILWSLHDGGVESE